MRSSRLVTLQIKDSTPEMNLSVIGGSIGNSSRTGSELAEKNIPVIAASFIALTAIVLNLITVLAVSKIKGPLPVNIRLVCCLLVFDLLNALTVIMDAVLLFGPATTKTSDKCLDLVRGALRHIAYNGTLLSLTSLALDLYIAIIYPLSYTRSVSKNRVTGVIVGIWTAALALGTTDFYLPPIISETFYKNNQSELSHGSYCEKRNDFNLFRTGFFTSGVTIVSLIVVSIVYTTVFCQIRRFQMEPTSNNLPSVRRNHRGLLTTLILLMVFVICFSPRFISDVHLVIETQTVPNANYALSRPIILLQKCLIYLPVMNAALDPILYAYRLRDIKQGYKKLFCAKVNRHSYLPSSRVRGRHMVRSSIATDRPHLTLRNQNSGHPDLIGLNENTTPVMRIMTPRIPRSAPPFGPDRYYGLRRPADWGSDEAQHGYPPPPPRRVLFQNGLGDEGQHRRGTWLRKKFSVFNIVNKKRVHRVNSNSTGSAESQTLTSNDSAYARTNMTIL